MLELTLTDYGRVCALFDPMQRHLAIRATLDGNHPGQIFVDDVQTPHVGLAVTPEGVFLAGDPHHAPGQAALKQFFRDVVFSGQLPALDDEVALSVAPENWQTYLPALIPTHEMSPATGYHYRCDGLRFDWRRHIPAGYTVRPIDRAFFEDSTITMSDEVAGWFDIEGSWRTLDDFLAHGVGCCVMQGNKVSRVVRPTVLPGIGSNLVSSLIPHTGSTVWLPLLPRPRRIMFSTWLPSDWLALC